MDPMQQFEQWFEAERSLSNLRLPAACCLSTIGEDGYPNARFVSLKEVVEGAFVITGSLSARKGQELNANPKAALSFWWTETERQVRVQGDVSYLSEAAADAYFAARSRAARVVSATFDQGQELPADTDLSRHFAEQQAEWEGQPIARPAGWGGLALRPYRMELMEFKTTRLHRRRLFVRGSGGWKQMALQP